MGEGGGLAKRWVAGSGAVRGQRRWTDGAAALRHASDWQGETGKAVLVAPFNFCSTWIARHVGTCQATLRIHTQRAAGRADFLEKGGKRQKASVSYACCPSHWPNYDNSSDHGPVVMHTLISDASGTWAVDSSPPGYKVYINAPRAAADAAQRGGGARSHGAAAAHARGAEGPGAAVGGARPRRRRRDRARAQRARGVRLPVQAGRARRAAQRVGAPALQRARRLRRLHARHRRRAAGRRRRVPGPRRHAAPLHRHAGLHRPQQASVDAPRGLCVADRRRNLARHHAHGGRREGRQRPAAPGPRADAPAHAPQAQVLPARRAPRRRQGEPAALCGVHRRGRHQTGRGHQHRHAAAHHARQGLAEPERLHAPPSHRRGGHAVGRAQPGAARGEQRPRPPADHPRRQQRRASVLPKLAQAHPRAAHAAGRQLVLPAARAPLRLSGRPRALRRRQRRRQQSRALAAATGAAVVPDHPGGPSRRSACGLDKHRAQNPPPAVRHCVAHSARERAGVHLSRASASCGERWSGRRCGCRLRHLLRYHGRHVGVVRRFVLPVQWMPRKRECQRARRQGGRRELRERYGARTVESGNNDRRSGVLQRQVPHIHGLGVQRLSRLSRQLHTLRAAGSGLHHHVCAGWTRDARHAQREQMDASEGT
ncbi:hypothetical protein FGB62_60g13 [Gracilaria domingensis]|nr:hypothetical protein FGB62_60g13 [Gracilaria domingensis]